MKSMFCPQKEEKEVISLRISTNLIKELDSKSAEVGISRNELIIQSILFGFIVSAKINNASSTSFYDDYKNRISGCKYEVVT